MAQEIHTNTLLGLRELLLVDIDKQRVDELLENHLTSLPEDYIINYSLQEIAKDIAIIEKLNKEAEYAIRLITNSPQGDHLWQIKLFKRNDIVSLSRGLPIIENFGVKLIDEQSYKITLADGGILHVCDFGAEISKEQKEQICKANIAKQLEEAIVATFNRQYENDALNKLVLQAGLCANEVKLFRGMTQYLAQTLPFSKAYLVDCLTGHPQAVEQLFALFVAKFNLESLNATSAATNDLVKHNKNYASTLKQLNQYLDNVTSLDDDRIIRAYVELIAAIVRTNYYQQRPTIAFKISSRMLSFLPQPVPLYEVFVANAQFEAIHLRAAKVARGGIRWSDRREDFRTEVLGLMKAQVVKNTLIVPSGAKGGFVCKKLPAISERDAYQNEGIACYKEFITSLLLLTDNIVNGQIVKPKNVVCYDDDDPYLVVAADKGTALFSDYANEIAMKHEFWLGDAFASGGLTGYDHKKMGITARGAWESVKRHFRHLCIDTQKNNFTVIAIGDMSGDVFGNGLLLSPHICLVAAFNHSHIFLDPQITDPLIGFQERKRLFALSHSTWDDYDTTKISEGGGVFLRSAKAINLSLAVKKWLDLDDSLTSLTPNELIKHILRAKADLLYNGGIGTYVKASSESHEQVKDKTNDAVRINGSDLQVRVVVEGGNLGITQLGRIEFAKLGGAINTDAVDNSAGVDCSDHEVNIKILFTAIMQQNKGVDAKNTQSPMCMNIATRNQILATMTNEVAQLVLHDNYLQTQCLRHAHVRANEMFVINVNFMRKLEKHGQLNAQVEFLPNEHEIQQRQRLGVGFTIPELAILLAYSKMVLVKHIMKANLCADTSFDKLLLAYFPKPLQRDYSEAIFGHYLRNEIATTQLVNLVVNRMGITFVSRFEDELGVNAVEIVRVFWLVYNLFDAQMLFEQIEQLDNVVPAALQISMSTRLRKTIERTIRWLLRNHKNDYIHYDSLINEYKAPISKLIAMLPQLLPSDKYQDIAKHITHFTNQGSYAVPDELVSVVARSSYIPQLLDIVMLAKKQQHDIVALAKNYFCLGCQLNIDWLRKHIIVLPSSNKWQALSRSALLVRCYSLYSHSLVMALKYAKNSKDEEFAKIWFDSHAQEMSAIKELFAELNKYNTLDLAMLFATVHQISTILTMAQ